VILAAWPEEWKAWSWRPRRAPCAAVPWVRWSAAAGALRRQPLTHRDTIINELRRRLWSLMVAAACTGCPERAAGLSEVRCAVVRALS